MNKPFPLILLGMIFCASLTCARAHAAYEHLTIALSTDVTTLDPHRFNMDTNNAIAEHVFDRLITKGADESLKPGLAVSWKSEGPRIWTFQLRKGVRFQDGALFTAKDVECSYRRAVKMAWGQHLGPIQSMRALSDTELQVVTDRPRPTLPNSLALVPIISCEQERASTADFDSGRAMNGTGPFIFVRRVPGKLIEFKRNPAYWGKAAPWQHLVFRIIRDPRARVAALESGKVDVIANVLGEAVSGVKRAGFGIFSRLSNRLILLHLDTYREVAEHVLGMDGTRVANPFRLKKVREAFMVGIDRTALVKEELGGMARPTGQLVPKGTLGYSSKLSVPTYDPESRWRPC